MITRKQYSLIFLLPALGIWAYLAWLISQVGLQEYLSRNNPNTIYELYIGYEHQPFNNFTNSIVFLVVLLLGILLGNKGIRQTKNYLVATGFILSFFVGLASTTRFLFLIPTLLLILFFLSRRAVAEKTT